MQHKTPFTYRSTLKLNNVEESDAKDYYCIGKVMNVLNYETSDTLPDYANYKLEIHGIIVLFEYLKVF